MPLTMPRTRVDPVGGEVRRERARGPGSRRRPRPRTGAARRCAARSPRAPGRGGRARACSPSRPPCPAPSAAAISVRAGSSPPISSTMTSTSASRRGGPARRSAGRPGGPRATAPAERRGRRPRRARAGRRRPAERAGRSRNARTTSRPTVPAPSTPTRSGGAAHGRARAVAHIGGMVADGRVAADRGEAPSATLADAMTTELAPSPAAALSARRRGRGSSRASSRRAIVHLGNDLGAIRNYVALQYEYEAIYCIVDYHALTSTHDPDVLRSGRARWRRRCWPSASTRSAARCSSRATGPEHTELAWLLATVTPVSWLERTPTYKEKKRQPARRHQPRAADLPGPAGGRHRHLQGVARAGRQGPGRPPRAVARDRPRVQQPLRRDVPRAAGASTPRRPSCSARTA